MKSSSKLFAQTILSDKRYWFLLVLFCLLFVVGKKVGEPRGPEEPFRRPAFLERDSAVVINTAQGGYVVQNALSALPDNSYRVIFSVALNEDPRKSNSVIKDSGADYIEVIVQSFGGKQLSIGKIMLEMHNSWQTHELIFTADNYYNTIYFKKDFSINTKDVLISSVEVDSVDDSITGSNPLSYYGDIELVPSKESVDLNSRDVIMSFYRKPIQFVQPFVAQAEKLYAIDVAMKFFGNGGDGDYALQLVALDDQNEITNVLSSASFNVGSEGTHQIAPSIYRFPVPTNLEIGKKYGVRISNESVRVGFIHHLQIYGTATSKSSIANSAISRRNGNSQTLNSLGAIRPIYANINSIDGDRLLVDSRVRAIDKDIAIFSYMAANKDENILDVFEANTSVHIDRGQHAFVAKINNDSPVDGYFIIKVVTILPINSIRLFADQYSSNNVQYSSLEYSLDLVDWLTLDVSRDRTTGSYNVILMPEQNTNIFYLRVSPEKNEGGTEGLRYFGISNLSISALLERR